MPLYESTFIARQDISTQDVENLTKQFSKIIEDNGGKVVKNEYWGLRNLAYVIKKNRKGQYFMLGIDASPAALKEMERNAKIHDDVLRNVSVRVEVLDKEPSFMMNSQGDYREKRFSPANANDE